MAKKAKIWNNIAGVVSFAYGIIFSITLIGIPIGFMLFIASRRFFDWAKLADTSLTGFKSLIVKWAVFTRMCALPFGLVSLIPLIIIRTNAKVSDIKSDSVFIYKPEENESVVQETKPQANEQNQTSKEETLRKLKEYLEMGIITEEEYNRASKELEKNE